MADKQDSAFVQATRSVFPRLPTEIIVSIVRLLVWLTTLSFVEHAPQVLRLPLIFIWFAVFLARYVLGSAKDPERRAARDRDRRRIGVRLPRAQIPYVAALFLLAFVVGPWWGAAFTGGCGKAEWVDFVFAPRATLTNDTLPIGLSVMLLGLSLATYPLVEEFCTRGWLLAALRERLGVHWAVAIAAFAFAFLHLTPYTRQFVSIFVFCFWLRVCRCIYRHDLVGRCNALWLERRPLLAERSRRSRVLRGCVSERPV
jgi:membrane protease YdiL (CAAX protease family)